MKVFSHITIKNKKKTSNFFSEIKYSINGIVKMNGKHIFATVGTTKFDTFVDTITQMEVLNTLKQRGYSSITLQIGNGSIIPSEENAKEAGINLIYYRFKNSIKDDISKADLVISHAGAGTCLEVLEEQKLLLVVVNEELMHNHQTELADQLSSDGYLFACTCASLNDTIKNMKVTKLKRMPPAEPKIFANYLNTFMGFKD